VLTKGTWQTYRLPKAAQAFDHAWNTEWMRIRESAALMTCVKMGKPTGWGGVWWKKDVKAGETSEPFLMTGFDHKVVHLKQASNEPVTFTIEVDFLGDGSWEPYQKIEVPAGGYVHHEFPAGFSAHWVRVRVDRDSDATLLDLQLMTYRSRDAHRWAAERSCDGDTKDFLLPNITSSILQSHSAQDSLLRRLRLMRPLQIDPA
jgi:hypothetical protein